MSTSPLGVPCALWTRRIFRRCALRLSSAIRSMSERRIRARQLSSWSEGAEIGKSARYDSYLEMTEPAARLEVFAHVGHRAWPMGMSLVRCDPSRLTLPLQ